jgi:hypothetical protein
MRIIHDYLKMKYFDPIFWFVISIALMIISNKYINQNINISNLYLVTGIISYIVAVIETIKKILKK